MFAPYQPPGWSKLSPNYWSLILFLIMEEYEHEFSCDFKEQIKNWLSMKLISAFRSRLDFLFGKVKVGKVKKLQGMQGCQCLPNWVRGTLWLYADSDFQLILIHSMPLFWQITQILIFIYFLYWSSSCLLRCLSIYRTSQREIQVWQGRYLTCKHFTDSDWSCWVVSPSSIVLGFYVWIDINELTLLWRSNSRDVIDQDN